MRIVARPEAARLGLKRYYTGRKCSRGHQSEHLVSNGSCIACLNENKARAYRRNPERTRIQTLRWRSDNKDRKKATGRRWYEKNRDSVMRRAAEWARRNPDKTRERSAAWRSEHAGLVNFWTATRRSRLAKRTPQWADLDAIAAIYAMCARVTRCTGIPHHVDHVVPISGKSVSGLHVPSNLRIIPARMNVRKSNRFDTLQAEALA